MPDSLRADVVIAGAGIVGASIAYLLSASGAKVVVLDRNLVGRGASCFSAGLHFPFFRSNRQLPFSVAGIQTLRQWRRERPAWPIYDLPLVGIASHAKAAAVLAQFHDGGMRVCENAESRALLETLPFLRARPDQAVMTGCTAGYGIPGEIAKRLIAESRTTHGALCFEGAPLARIAPKSGGFLAETRSGVAVEARFAVVSTGPWLFTDIDLPRPESLGVRVKKVACLQIALPPVPGAPAVYFFDEDCFLLPRRTEGDWLFSFTSREWDVKPDDPLAVTENERKEALEVLDRYAPGWPQLCGGARVFCDSYSEDWAPLVVEMVPGLVFAGACSGAGYRLAGGIAQRVAGLLGIAGRSPHAKAGFQ